MQGVRTSTPWRLCLIRIFRFEEEVNTMLFPVIVIRDTEMNKEHIVGTNVHDVFDEDE